MAEVKCEECRNLQADYSQSKELAKVFGDKDRDFSWKVSIDNHSGGTSHWEYVFDDARGDVSINDIAMLIKLFLDSDSYSSKLVREPDDSKQ